MVELTAETAVIAALGSIALAVILWVVTNVHVLRVGRAIKSDIDSKRAETERFVKDQLSEITRKIDTIAIPELPDLNGQFTTIRAEIKSEFERARASIDGHFGVGKRAAKQIGEAIAGAAGEEALAAAGIDPNDPRLRLKQAFDRFGLDAKWSKEHPQAAIGLELLKEALNDGGGLPALASPRPRTRTGRGFGLRGR